MPKKFDILYVAWRADVDPTIQYLQSQGYTARKILEKTYRSVIPAGSHVAQILGNLFPGQPLTTKQPAYWILTREIAPQPRVSSLNMNALISGMQAMSMKAAQEVQIVQQQGQGAVAQQIEATDEQSQEELGDAVEDALDKELAEKMGAARIGGKRKTHRMKRKSRSLKRRYSKRS